MRPLWAAVLSRSFWRYLSIAVLTLSSLTYPSLSRSATPSFSCGRNIDAVASLICSDDQLARFDAEMAAMYRSMIQAATTDERSKLVDEQRRWLSTRTAGCSGAPDIDCLRNAYRTRIGDLIRKGDRLGIRGYRQQLKPGQVAILQGGVMTCGQSSVDLTFPEGAPDSVDDETGADLPGKPVTLAPDGVLQVTFAECRLHDGTSIRVKTGMVSPPMAYGMCGASPAIQLSAWVDQRHVISSLVYTNYCEASVLTSFSIDSKKAYFCLKPDADFSGADEKAFKPTNGLCGDLSFGGTDHIDASEFAPKGQTIQPVGTLSVEADGPLRETCARMISKVPGSEPELPEDIAKPIWEEKRANLVQVDFTKLGYSATSLSAEKRYAEASFDLANTGKVTKVYSIDQENHWFDGTAFGIEHTDTLVTPFDPHDWDASVAKGIYPFTYEHASVFFALGKTHILLIPVNELEDPSVITLHGTSSTIECTFHRIQEHF